MSVVILCGFVGGIVVGCVILFAPLLRPAVRCPKCGEKLPKFRKPASSRQLLLGGWTCPECRCNVMPNGREAEA